jgi:AcrR family transcriptional regulator
MTETAKTPQQGRGFRRVTLLLDAAIAEILLTGVDGLTMNAVAKRAATAPGSLYQFFPGRQALFLALADRYELTLGALADEVAARVKAQSMPSIADTALAFLRPFIAWYGVNPAYLVLAEAMPRVLPPDRLADTRVAAALADCLRPHVAVTARPRLETATRLMVEVGHAFIGAPLPNDGPVRDQWFVEGERLIVAYVTTLAGPETRR